MALSLVLPPLLDDADGELAAFSRCDEQGDVPPEFLHPQRFRGRFTLFPEPPEGFQYHCFELAESLFRVSVIPIFLPRGRLHHVPSIETSMVSLD